MEVLQNLDLQKSGALSRNNIAQTFQLVSTGNGTRLCFWIQVKIDPNVLDYSLELYSPIQQDAVLLHKGLIKLLENSWNF